MAQDGNEPMVNGEASDENRNLDGEGDEDEESDDQGEEVYVVEAILDKRVKRGEIQYFIKWKGYENPEDNTWEPKANCHCPDLIEAFEEKFKLKEKEKKSKAEVSRTPSSSKQRKWDEQSGGSERDRREKSSSKEPKSAAKKKNLSKATVDELSSEETDNDSDNDLSKGIDGTLAEPTPGKEYLVQKGSIVSAVLGVKKFDKGGMTALVKYEDGVYELVPTAVLSDQSPRAIIEFYESRLRFF